MSRDLKTFGLRLAALGAAACSSAYALHRPSAGGPLQPVPPPMQRSPYDVELVGEDGRPLATYERGGRFYVLGEAGTRYSIRVTNPTPRRVEAVISVDGLDVIDGELADFAGKRGYVVPAGGDLVVDGFRMSTMQVAAFRFSPVGDSYAELKGKGRNVGVIGVAIFEETQPQIVVPEPATPMPVPEPHPWYGGPADGRMDAESSNEEARSDAPSRGSAADAPARRVPMGRAERPASTPPAASAEAKAGGDGDAAASSSPAAPSPPPPPGSTRGTGEFCCGGSSRPSSRPGLGTEWGEERYSAVDFTRFERANAAVPTAMAELRYNDAGGLRALGISLQPEPDGDELWRRETADPFPARGFAAPP